MIDPVAFRIGSFAIYWYGIILTSGILAVGLLTAKRAERAGYDPDHAWNALMLCMVLGIIGARLYHVFTPTPSMGDPLYYWHNPLQIFNLRRGGLGIYGAIIGAVIGIIIYARRAGLDPWVWMDLAAPAVPLGQAIGRWGNFINQELYGFPTDLPWAIYISPENRLPGYRDYERFHPLFLYESLWNLAAFGLLMYLSRPKADGTPRLLKGELVGLYVIIYSLGRFLLEFLRLDTPFIGSSALSIAQIFSLVLIAGTGGVMIYR
ncbi:MAG: prolipoprotein diacylglyceryl transferase, partial [Anaerolineae bacterium]|nr:prolipoprotein diacylglyceryl transferase [Anaerolineae bacterium]